MLLGFGRCDLPHMGHVHLLNSVVDFFCLSNSKERKSTELRIALLEKLGGDVSKIIVGSPYRVLKNFKEKYGEDLVVVCEKSNEHLPIYLGINVSPLKRVNNISSSRLKKDKILFNEYYSEKGCLELALSLI